MAQLALNRFKTFTATLTTSSQTIYTAPTGYNSIQQDNLPTTNRGVSGLVWMKNRDTTDAPQWYDSSRGKHVYFVTNSTAAEATATDGLQKFLAG